MREVIAEYTAEQVYSTARQEIQDQIRQRAVAMLGEKMVERTADQSEFGDQYQIPLYEMLNLIDTLVLGIELPPSVVTAINRKIEQYYISEEYTFRVAREVKESNARRSKRKASANSRPSSAKESRTPTCVGAASRQRFSSGSPRIRRS